MKSEKNWKAWVGVIEIAASAMELFKSHAETNGQRVLGYHFFEEFDIPTNGTRDAVVHPEGLASHQHYK